VKGNNNKGGNNDNANNVNDIGSSSSSSGGSGLVGAFFDVIAPIEKPVVAVSPFVVAPSLLSKSTIVGAAVDVANGSSNSGGSSGGIEINQHYSSPPLSGNGSSSGRSSNGSGANDDDLGSDLCILNGLRAASTSCIDLAIMMETFHDEESFPPSSSTTTTTTREDDQKEDYCSHHLINSTNIMNNHAQSYKRALRHRASIIVAERCGDENGRDIKYHRRSNHRIMMIPLLTHVRQFVASERYDERDGNSDTFVHAESDRRLELDWLLPMKKCPLIQAILSRSDVGNDGGGGSVEKWKGGGGSSGTNSVDTRMATDGVCRGLVDGEVAAVIVEELSHRISEAVIDTILIERKPFTEWGSLLFSKQVRMVENFLCDIIIATLGTGAITTVVAGNGSEDIVSGGARNDVTTGNTSGVLQRFQRLSRAVAVLQLGRPSDLSVFSYNFGNDGDWNNNDCGRHNAGLNSEEIRRIMLLRVDFSEDAVASVCGTLANKDRKRWKT